MENIGEKKSKVVEHIQSGGIYVDNSGIEDVGRTIIQDRKDLAERGVSQDNTQAVYWYRKAAEQGHPGAKEILEKDFGIEL